MKKRIFLAGLLLPMGMHVFAQQVPTTTAPAGAGANGTNNAQFWSRAGNTNAPGSNQNNIFGTMWNSPIYTKTNGVTRTRLNGLLSNNYLGTGYFHDVTGHFGIGLNGYFDNETPLTMLHLEGPSNVPQFTGGQFRHWMRTGLFARENSDAMYVGMKPEGSNRSDAVVSWSDDVGGTEGPDNLRFLFNTVMTGLPGAINPLQGNSQNGYEMMRMTASGPFNEANFPAGHIGIGPLFNDINRPQNRLHMNAESGLATFMQISNIAGAGPSGTGQTATDGLKLGIQNFLTPMGNRQYGYLQWQEHTPFIVQTAWSGFGGSTATGERMRITSRGALVNTEGFAYPASLNSPNITRIAISYLGSSPVTQPRSLVHMGFNGPDSWRSWMDLGTYASSADAHTYLGVFDGTSNGVLAWGGTGSGDMRYVFTQANGAGNEPGTPDGLEAMRMTPAGVDGVHTGIGGDPNANLYGPAASSITPTATLEVNSWGATTVPGGNSGLRFSNLNTTSPILTNPGPGVLAVDADGDVVYVQSTGDGLDCWDQDGDGIGDPNEDLNGDSLFNYLDCVSLPCWDINQNGVFDIATEDFDGSGDASPNDCKGPQGSIGATGPAGPTGATGPQGPAGNAIFFADNGVSRNPGSIIRLGDAYNSLPTPLFNTNTPLTTNRQVRLGGNNFVFSGNGNVAVGLTHPQQPTERLDVNGNARFRNVPTQVAQYIMLGTINSGINDVELSKLPFSGSTNQYLSGNGSWQPFPVSAFGATCGAAPTVGALTTDTRVNLNNKNLYFTYVGSSSLTNSNKVAVGYTCGSALPARFNVFQRELTPIGISTIASYAENKDIGLTLGLEYIGVRGIAQGQQSIQRITNTGGSFLGQLAPLNYGVKGYATSGFPIAGISNGGDFEAYNGGTARGISARAHDALMNIGILAEGRNGTSAYGIWARAQGASTLNRSGYFEGQMETTGGPLITSDSQFKTGVTGLNGSLKLISALKPVSYNMDVTNYPQFNFDQHLQFGFIAQQVEQVFPNLVYDSYRPSLLDSLGNPTDSSATYKSLNYTGLIPINTAAIIELNQKVDKATLSDQTIKTNVQDLTGSLDKVLDMRGVSYDWNHTVHPELNLDSVNHVGFIAQEMAQIDSRLTYLADDSLLHVEYDKVVPILAEAIQELNDSIGVRDSIINVLVTENNSQQTTINTLSAENAAQQSTIDDLNNRLTQLENCLSGILPYLCQLSNSAIQANTPAAQEEVRKNLNVTLNNRNAIVLDQNVPNPFAEQTIINFSIPETVKKAQIHFYDGNGRFMNSVEVTERGLGSVTVFGSDLSTGVYTYTLVADGQVVATKKMMKQ